MTHLRVRSDETGYCDDYIKKKDKRKLIESSSEVIVFKAVSDVN